MSVILPIEMQKEKESGNPFFIELYTIFLTTGTIRLAATDENIEYNGDTYMAVPFQRSDIGKNLDAITDSCDVSMGDCSYELLRFIMNGFDFRGCRATILRIKYPDSMKDPNVVSWVFSGFIDEPSFTNGTFACKLVSEVPDINCPNRNYRLACNSEFGDEECGMSLSEETVSVLSCNAQQLTLSVSHDDGYWKDGVITVEGESRVISSSSGAQVTVNVGFAHPPSGKSAKLVRGCNKTAERCNYYNNSKHYGGFLAIPFESVYR